ncbi:FAD/NAD(P)-binding domain-containing protein [Zopfia rhizophila CBS 207.26]|uniref:FAD/NAD(P)-binding domain-containing protein n=1 Tax=Zopfia rhizophila CBS 207.26 TaxID=1314779 RepID=A0A6A6E7J1_9PEZI|nr:FAD/NAD(P)-binding domain-containing protein [Zopfia rhizophila CBS 207.26]
MVLSSAQEVITTLLPSDQGAVSAKTPHVCIVGAGISGLRCASELLAHGVQVTIIEARDRIGGRICQSNELGYTVDFGPNWIHTSGSNPILDLANLTGTVLHIWNEKVQVFDHDGKRIEDETAKVLGELRWDIIEKAMRYSKENTHRIDKNDSLGQWFEKRTAEMEISEYDRKVLIGMAEMWGCYIGDSIYHQSLKYTWLEDCCSGEELIVASSYAAILAEIARVPLKSANLLLSQQVVGVSSFENSVNGRGVAIETANGDKFTFDDVVMTTPLGWLKRNESAFQPSLPDPLREAIGDISVGHLEKVYITFPKAWWKAAREDEYPGYTNWICPKYASDTNPDGWPQEAYDLAAFPEPHSHPTLLLYLYGDCSAHISNLVYTLPKDKQYPALDAFFKPYYSKLPRYDDVAEDCRPKAFLATAWRFDELSGNGSYCNFQVGIENADKHVEALQLGLPDRGIWFAGEHTAPLEEMGTVAGAYLSGERAARRILEQYSLFPSHKRA